MWVDNVKQWCCGVTPKSFDLSKIRAKSAKIWAKFMKMFPKFLKILGKLPENTDKNGAQKLFSSEKLAPNVERIT